MASEVAAFLGLLGNRALARTATPLKERKRGGGSRGGRGRAALGALVDAAVYASRRGPDITGRSGRCALRLPRSCGEGPARLGSLARPRERQHRCRARPSAGSARSAAPRGGLRLVDGVAVIAGRDPFANLEQLLRRVYAYVAIQHSRRNRGTYRLRWDRVMGRF
jgi:hypothetical protein